MHHGPDAEAVRKISAEVDRAAQQEQLGATGDFPDGKLTPDDEGGIRLAVGVAEGKVVLSFGKPVAWVGLDPKQARALAESLRKSSYRV